MLEPLIQSRYKTVQLVCLLVALSALYALTMPRVITLEDAGLFQMVCHLGGISHPPGYPLFTGICQELVFGDSTLAGNLMSVYFAIAAVIILYFVVIEMTHDHTVSLVAAGAYGVTSCFWSQAVIVEVYTFAATLFLSCWWLLLKFLRTQHRGYWYALCATAGLAISNHWPLFVLSCVGFLSLLVFHRKHFYKLCNPITIVFSVVLLMLGLSPYLLLFQVDPAIGMYGEVSLNNFSAYFFRDYYSDDHIGARVADKLAYLRWMFPLSLFQLGWVGVPFILLGVVSLRSFMRWEDILCAVGVFVASTFILVLLLNFRFELQTRAIFLPYPIIAVAIVALCFSIGLVRSLRLIQKTNPRLSYLVASLVLASIVITQYPARDRSTSRLADEYARVVLDTLPTDAVLFVGGDNQIGPIGYRNKVKGHRPDVTVYSKDGLLFRDRVVPLHSSETERLKVISSFQQKTPRRVFTTDRLTPYDIDYGLYYEFLSKSQALSIAGAQTDTQLGVRKEKYLAPEVLLPEIELFADYLIHLDANELIQDGHEQVFLHSLLVSISRQYSQYAVRIGTPALGKTKARRLASLQKTLPGKLSGLRTLLINRPSNAELLSYALDLEQQLEDSISNQHDALAYEFIGRIYSSQGDLDAAREYFLKSVMVYPTDTNASLCELNQLAPAQELASLLAKYHLKLESCGEV